MTTGGGARAAVTVYTRPGCPYCFLLRRALRRRRVIFDEVNIWQDPQAAAAVRAVADGNETVPTVHVAGQWLVNPRAAHVERLAAAASGS
jgi:mycoredoxin